jgi:hypothetical protein
MSSMHPDRTSTWAVAITAPKILLRHYQVQVQGHQRRIYQRIPSLSYCIAGLRDSKSAVWSAGGFG